MSKIAKRRSGFIRPLFFTIFAEICDSCWAQDLAPRAYLITPVHSNAINLTYSFFHGGLDFNGVIPVTGATGTYSVPNFSYYHSFSFFGRSANIAAWLPYGVGTFQGSVLGTNKQIYRSGLLDLGFRFVRESEGWPRDARLAVREVEAKDGVGRKLESDLPDRPV